MSSGAVGVPDVRSWPERLVVLLVPVLFVAALLLLERMVLSPLLPLPLDLVVSVLLAALGIVIFTLVILRRLDAAQERVIRQNRQLAALDEASIMIASELSLDRVLQRITDIVRNLSGARYAALGVLGQDGYLTNLISSGLTPEERARIGQLPRNHGILGTMLREGRPVRVSDVSREPARSGFPPNHPRMKKLMGVPIVSGSTIIGDLYLADKLDGSDFNDDDERLIVLLAAHAAVAIENARLHEQVQKLAAYEERTRIARELHDGSIQSIYAVTLILEDAADLLASDPGAARARLDEAIDALNGVITELRGYISDLRSRLAPSSLTEMLADLIALHRRNTQMDIEFSAEGQFDTDAELSWQIIQLAREALANIARHARASKVWVQLAGDGEHLTLRVTDNGRGFDPTATRSQGYGLRNMRERVAALGGSVTIESIPGEGTALTFSIPIPQGAHL